ncbi:MAG: M56 family metallopeptidase [Lachnospiraceae bacterium]|nr:M56 family metallopeptidase [Lachnospiraceae bacterium]
MRVVFQHLWNMSLKASWVILVVLLTRLLLQKVPRRYVCFLWLPVLVRLLCPVLPFAGPSLIPAEVQSLAEEWSGLGKEANSRQGKVEHLWQQPVKKEPELSGQQRSLEVGKILEEESSGEPIPLADTTYKIEETGHNTSRSSWMEWGSILWLVGFLFLLFWNFGGFIFLSRRLYRGREPLEAEWRERKGEFSKGGGGIWQVCGLELPFVLGIFRPQIYLPKELDREELPYVLCHEIIHMERRDPLWKALGFLALCLHWFHPLVWVAFYLASQDIEMACDEGVLARLGEEVREDYSASLIHLSLKRPRPFGGSAAFGEGNPKRRIQHVLRYKKPAFLTSCGAMVLILVLSGGLLLNREEGDAWSLMLNIDSLQKETPGEKGLGTEQESGGAVPGGDPRAWDFRPARERMGEIFDTLAGQSFPDSDPWAYLDAQPEAFQKLLQQPHAAMAYCFEQFEQGGQTGLKGRLMAEFVRHCMGKTEEAFDYVSGQQWYEAVKAEALLVEQEQGQEYVEKYQMLYWWILQYLEGEMEKYGNEILLPDFSYEGEDEILKLLYETEKNRKEPDLEGFMVWAIHSYGSYEEGDTCKVVAVVYTGRYQLFGDQVEEKGGSVIPVALTCKQQEDGTYTCIDYQMAGEGSEFGPSIEAFCTMPESKEWIPGLAERILAEYGNDQELHQILEKNLQEHLKKWL